MPLFVLRVFDGCYIAAPHSPVWGLPYQYQFLGILVIPLLVQIPLKQERSPRKSIRTRDYKKGSSDRQ